MAPNVPAIYEASFAVPMVGAVLNTLNVRLDAATIAFGLQHAEVKLLILCSTAASCSGKRTMRHCSPKVMRGSSGRCPAMNGTPSR